MNYKQCRTWLRHGWGWWSLDALKRREEGANPKSAYAASLPHTCWYMCIYIYFIIFLYIYASAGRNLHKCIDTWTHENMYTWKSRYMYAVSTYMIIHMYVHVRSYIDTFLKHAISPSKGAGKPWVSGYRVYEKHPESPLESNIEASRTCLWSVCCFFEIAISWSYNEVVPPNRPTRFHWHHLDAIEGSSGLCKFKEPLSTAQHPCWLLMGLIWSTIKKNLNSNPANHIQEIGLVGLVHFGAWKEQLGCVLCLRRTWARSSREGQHRSQAPKGPEGLETSGKWYQ